MSSLVSKLVAKARLAEPKSDNGKLLFQYCDATRTFQGTWRDLDAGSKVE